MKTKKLFFTVIGFISGMVIGISMIGLYSFTSGPAASAPTGGIVPITAAEANAFVRNYQADAAPLNKVIKGFTIDKEQLDAMNSIIKENPALTGFRIYLGKNIDARTIGIVVGVDNTGKDAFKNTIFNTDSKNLSPCPPICDVSSPIVINE
ncbi:MAG: hypothetical protein Q8M08_02830 [Bacteroidales bacterium]|nr:hypothetical protein [Bacteroidales bacterium]